MYRCIHTGMCMGVCKSVVTMMFQQKRPDADPVSGCSLFQMFVGDRLYQILAEALEVGDHG